MGYHLRRQLEQLGVSNLLLGGTGHEADMFRIAANTNTADWGANDHVDVDFLRFKSLDDPATPTPSQMWMDAAEGSVDPSAN